MHVSICMFPYACFHMHVSIRVYLHNKSSHTFVYCILDHTWSYLIYICWVIHCQGHDVFILCIYTRLGIGVSQIGVITGPARQISWYDKMTYANKGKPDKNAHHFCIFRLKQRTNTVYEKSTWRHNLLLAPSWKNKWSHTRCRWRTGNSMAFLKDIALEIGVWKCAHHL